MAGGATDCDTVEPQLKLVSDSLIPFLEAIANGIEPIFALGRVMVIEYHRVRIVIDFDDGQGPMLRLLMMDREAKHGIPVELDVVASSCTVNFEPERVEDFDLSLFQR